MLVVGCRLVLRDAYTMVLDFHRPGRLWCSCLAVVVSLSVTSQPASQHSLLYIFWNPENCSSTTQTNQPTNQQAVCDEAWAWLPPRVCLRNIGRDDVTLMFLKHVTKSNSSQLVRVYVVRLFAWLHTMSGWFGGGGREWNVGFGFFVVLVSSSMELCGPR